MLAREREERSRKAPNARLRCDRPPTRRMNTAIAAKSRAAPALTNAPRESSSANAAAPIADHHARTWGDGEEGAEGIAVPMASAFARPRSGRPSERSERGTRSFT